MDRHTAKVANQFGAVAEAYLSSPVHSQGADLDAVAERFRNRPEATVLDLGCGAGHLSFAIAPHVRSVVAYDLSAAMIDLVANEAKRRGVNNISTQMGNAERLPFEGASFDSVCSRYSAHHWTEIRKALREVRRVLKPGGSFIVVDVCAPASPLLDTHLQTIELLRDRSHVRDYTHSEWQSMLEDAGFAFGKQEAWKLSLDFNAWVERMKTPSIYVEAIRSLLQGAPQEVQDYFLISEDGSFVPDAILIEAELTTSRRGIEPL